LASKSEPKFKKAPGNGDRTVRYTGRHARVLLPAIGEYVARGQAVAVPAAVADSLLEQKANWAEGAETPARPDKTPAGASPDVAPEEGEQE
jgi:hypothetical protein